MIVYFVNTLQRRKYVVPRWVADLLVTMKVWEYGMVPYHIIPYRFSYFVQVSTVTISGRTNGFDWSI